ncbi:MAG: hypothetical protein JXB23_01365 [Candidatus Aminicenantes bacterium]|nr:hypothetical protein [Candidatus Aminicenantes bacterium]
MKKVQVFFLLPIFLFSFLLAWYTLFTVQAKDFSFLDHSFRVPWFTLLLVTLILGFTLSAFWYFSGKSLVKNLGLSFDAALSRDLMCYLPLLWLLLLPLTTLHYLSSEDLLSRLRLFGLALLFAVLYLKLSANRTQAKEARYSFRRFVRNFSLRPQKTKLALLFFVSLLFYNAGSAVLTFTGSNFSGDEPHYLLITHSLLKDGDFDLSDNYANSDYDTFMRAPVNIQRHTAPGTEGKYSFHSPGISLLMGPFYALGSLFGRTGLSLMVRFGMSIFGALLGLQIFLFAQQAWREERTAFQIWAVYGFTSPVFFYAIHVYPELIVSLLSLTVFRLVRFRRAGSCASLVFCGSLLALFIWFHALKYLFILIPLFLYTIWILIKERRTKKDMLCFIGPFVGITAVYFLFQFRLYGSLSLSAVSWRGAVAPQESLAYLKQLIQGIPFRFRWETLAGYFLDQRDGILLYSPLYFFSFLGIIVLLRKKWRELVLLFILTGPYVLSSAFLTQRTGYAPQARPLMAVSWGLIILVGSFLADNDKRIFTSLFSLASCVSFLFVPLLLCNHRALYQPTTVGEVERAGLLFQKLSNLHFSLPEYLPSFIKIEDPHWPPNWIWIAGLAVFMTVYLIVKPHNCIHKFWHRLLISSVGLSLFFVWFVFYPRTIIALPQNISYPGGEKITFYAYSRSARMIEPGTLELIESDRDYSFYFSSRLQIKELLLEFGSTKGAYEVELRYFDTILFRGKTSEEIKNLRLSSMSSYRLGKKNLYHLSLTLKSDSDVSAAAYPYRLMIQPVK